MKVSYCTVGFGDRDLTAALDAIASAGFSCLELTTLAHVPRLEDVSGTAQKVHSQVVDRGLTVTTVHAPTLHTALGVPTEDWRQEKAKLLAEYIHFSAEIEATEIIIHPVPNPMFVPDWDAASMPAAMRAAARRSLDELVGVADKAGVRILLENLACSADWPSGYPLNGMKELRSLVEDYPADQLGLVIDTGHVGIAGLDPGKEIAIAGDRLYGTHLHDLDLCADPPDDNHWVPMKGGLDWDAIRSALVRVSYAGALTFEVINGPGGEKPEELASQTRVFASEWGF